MHQPRLASATLDRASYCRNVFRCTEEQFHRLPVQWRGFVLHRLQFGQAVEAVLDQIDRGLASAKLDPQGVFNAYQGLAPQ